ncbi:hypothetical protein L9F63_023890, partial [Diploptera punctata]
INIASDPECSIAAAVFPSQTSKAYVLGASSMLSPLASIYVFIRAMRTIFYFFALVGKLILVSLIYEYSVRCGILLLFNLNLIYSIVLLLY